MKLSLFTTAALIASILVNGENTALQTKSKSLQDKLDEAMKVCKPLAEGGELRKSYTDAHEKLTKACKSEEILDASGVQNCTNAWTTFNTTQASYSNGLSSCYAACELAGVDCKPKEETK